MSAYSMISSFKKKKRKTRKKSGKRGGWVYQGLIIYRIDKSKTIVMRIYF